MASVALHVYMFPMLFFELLIVVALILLNGVLAMAELAVVSSRRARLQALINREVVGARRALALASDPGRFLSTVQIGITLNGVLSGAFSGATLGQRLVQWFVAVGLSPAIAEIVGVGLVVAAITYVSLIVGELVPKQIALRDPERVAVRLAPAMTLLAKVASPAVWLLDVSGRLVLRALGYGRQVEQRVTDEEIKTLIAEAETAGVIEPSERAMIAGVMRLGDRPVSIYRPIQRRSGAHSSRARIHGCPFTTVRQTTCWACCRPRICSKHICAVRCRIRARVCGPRPTSPTPRTLSTYWK
jgi:putative hemolysin